MSQLKLSYITNNLTTAKYADNAGIDEIFVDLEIHGKHQRQKDRDTVISNHSIEDISKIKETLSNSSLLVRCNPIGEWSKNEIDKIIQFGADTVMLPFFKKIKEVEMFLDIINERVKTNLLVETIDAVKNLESILKLDQVNRIHIGLNDLHIEVGNKFMFEPFANGMLDNISEIAKKFDVSFGIGGISKIGSHLIPSPESLIGEHKRLGSSAVILSRSFLASNHNFTEEEIENHFKTGIQDIREREKLVESWTKKEFQENRKLVKKDIKRVIRDM